LNKNREPLDNQPYQKILQEYLQGELRILNAHLPGEQKRLSELLTEEYPHIKCHDGSTHLFKRKELDYLTTLIDSDEQQQLFLPILVEVRPDQDEIAVICRSQVEEKVIGKILDMPLTIKQNRIMLYKRQLAQLRAPLKTTTQYAFRASVV